MTTVINWFEIPVTDFARAQRFYEQVFNVKLRVEDMHGMKMGVFPHTDPATGGALTQMEGCTPGDSGVVIYLHGGKDLSAPLQRAVAAGGTVVLEKMPIPPNGFIALLTDSEGNRIGLHSMS